MAYLPDAFSLTERVAGARGANAATSYLQGAR